MSVDARFLCAELEQDDNSKIKSKTNWKALYFLKILIVIIYINVLELVGCY